MAAAKAEQAGILTADDDFIDRYVGNDCDVDSVYDTMKKRNRTFISAVVNYFSRKYSVELDKSKIEEHLIPTGPKEPDLPWGGYRNMTEDEIASYREKLDAYKVEKNKFEQSLRTLPLRYEQVVDVLCAGGKLPKPEEIRGVRKFASVPFEGICQCQLFLKGDDLYIKHNDYFSETHSTGKIDPRTNMEERVLYICHAWLRITNFVPLIKLLNDVEISATVWPMLRDFHQWPAGEYNMEWNRFLEGVARATRNYLSKKEAGYGTENL